MHFIKVIVNLCCILAALMVPVTTIHNLNNYWEGDDIAHENSIGYISIPIGGSSITSSETTTIFSRSYALFPVSFSTPKMLYVSSEDNGQLRTSFDATSFWLFFSVIVYGWYRIIHTTIKFRERIKRKNNGSDA